MSQKRTSSQAATSGEKANPVKRIVFSGDFLRPAVSGLRPTQHENIQWLYQLLKVPLEMATGLHSEIVHWDNRWPNQSRLDQGTVTAIYQMLGQKAGIYAWPKIFDAAELPKPIEDLFLRYFADAFVIGFELPPYLVKFLDRHGIGFIDCSLSPVRFMDDLLFELSSNVDAATQELCARAVPSGLIRLQAGVISSNVAKLFPNPPLPNTLLVILQTRFDKVVIQNRRFTTMLDHLDALREIADGYDRLIVKQHPLEPQPEVAERLEAMFAGRVETSTENFYRLVSHHNVAGVAALSSSCVHEAEFFGKTGHYLLEGFTPASATPGQKGANIDDAVICPDFWRDILAPTQCPVTPHDGLRLPTKTNRFRLQLHAAWGYNQIDTDIAAEWLPTGNK